MHVLGPVLSSQVSPTTYSPLGLRSSTHNQVADFVKELWSSLSMPLPDPAARSHLNHRPHSVPFRPLLKPEGPAVGTLAIPDRARRTKARWLRYFGFATVQMPSQTDNGRLRCITRSAPTTSAPSHPSALNGTAWLHWHIGHSMFAHGWPCWGGVSGHSSITSGELSDVSHRQLANHSHSPESRFSRCEYSRPHSRHRTAILAGPVGREGEGLGIMVVRSNIGIVPTPESGGAGPSNSRDRATAQANGCCRRR
jgi:hypothetical protein